MASIGGGVIKSYHFTRAWGVNPAEAGGQIVVDNSEGGGSITLTVGSYVVFAFGSIASASGILTQVRESIDATSGTLYSFTLLDNRIRLGVEWAMVVGAWNIPDDRVFRRIDRPLSPDSYSSDTSSPGADDLDLGSGVSAPSAVPTVAVDAAVAGNPLRRRRYKHLLPEHARAGIWTYTDGPLSVRQILNSAFGGAWAEYSFNRSYHSSMSQVFPNGVDATSGIALASLISQMLDLCGLDMKLEGSRTLVFDRKGVGLPPLPDDYSISRDQAESLSPKPSKVRVLGDAFRVQVHNLAMVPDWIRGWEDWIDEMAWIRKVGEVFELPSETKSDCAERAAFAREVTMAQFIAAAELPALADYRACGRGSRMQMPAWDYIQEFVLRSYRLPSDFTLGGIPLASLKWSEGLLAGVMVSGSGAATKQMIRSDQPEIYPDARAHVIVKGQPLDLVDARSIALFSMRRNKDLREEWIEWSEYEVDTENWSIRFRAPIFIDGLASEGKSILQFINKGEGGPVDLTELVAEDSDYLDVVVPNPDFEISPAGVRISICFECGQFQKDFGVGPRRTVSKQSGLSMELIDVTDGSTGITSLLGDAPASLLPFPSPVGRTLKELLYADGGSAEAAAGKVAASIISRPVSQLAGGFTRKGVTGSALGPCVDRVTITIEGGDGGGVTEQVELTKAKSTQAFLAETTLTRLQRVGELFPGQEESRNQIRMLRLIAKLENDYSRTPSERTHRTISDVFRRPVGGEHQSTETLFDKNNQSPLPDGRGWKVGDVVWKDEAGFPSRTGTVFGGVLVSTPSFVGDVQGRDLNVATRGKVPVRISGSVPAGGVVQSIPGQAYGAADGSSPIGQLAHGAPVPVSGDGEVLALVRLGAGGGAGGKVGPLTLTSSRPSYIPEPETAVASGSARFFMNWGSINGVIADNWKEPIDVPIIEDGTYYVSAKCWISDTASEVVVTHWVFGFSTDPAIPARPEWGADGSRPEFTVIPLGQIKYDSFFHPGTPEIIPHGAGSIQIDETVVGLRGTETGDVLEKRQFVFRRLVY